MAKVIAGKHLQELIGNNTLLCNGVVSNCDGIKYDFRLDDTILKSKYGVPINYSTFPVEKQLDAFKRTLIRNSDTIIELDELVHKTTRNIERISIDIENLKESLKLESEARKDSLRLEEEARKEALRIETEARKDSLRLEEEARKKISSEVNKKVLRLQGALWLATAIISGVATVVIGVLTGLIKF